MCRKNAREEDREGEPAGSRGRCVAGGERVADRVHEAVVGPGTPDRVLDELGETERPREARGEDDQRPPPPGRAAQTGAGEQRERREHGRAAEPRQGFEDARQPRLAVCHDEYGHVVVERERLRAARDGDQQCDERRRERGGGRCEPRAGRAPQRGDASSAALRVRSDLVFGDAACAVRAALRVGYDRLFDDALGFFAEDLLFAAGCLP